MAAPIEIDTRTWRTRADYDAWWAKNGDAVRRLTVATPPRDLETITNPEWHRIARQIEVFLARVS